MGTPLFTLKTGPCIHASQDDLIFFVLSFWIHTPAKDEESYEGVERFQKATELKRGMQLQQKTVFEPNLKVMEL